MSYPVHPIPPADGQLPSVAGMTPQQIEQALAGGQLQWLLSGQNPPAPGLAPGPAVVPAPAPADGQYSEEWLKTAPPGLVEQALKEGKLHHLLTGENPPDVPAAGQLGEEHLKVMGPAEIAEAHAAGRFSTLLGAPPPAEG